MLVGTSLIVIIPEGVETLYSASESSHSHVGRSLSALGPRAASVDIMGDFRNPQMVAIPLDTGIAADGCAYVKKRQDDAADGQPEEDGPEGGHQNEAEEQTSRDPHVWVGISLITGFILMYLIDTLPRHASGPSQPQRFSISLTQFSLTRGRTSSVPETPTTSAAEQHHSSTSRPSSTTVGLVIHACADGIALGASTTTTSRLSFIIFIALMIHKAPAAFGLTSVLLKQGLSTRAARAHLIVFSLAAPVGALLTWGAAHLLGYSSDALGSSTSTEFATGVLLLFSGGTFLYVAMHTMQDSGGHSHDEQGNGYVSVPMADIYGSAPPSAPKTDSGGLADTLVCVVGMLIPLLTQLGHGH